MLSCELEQFAVPHPPISVIAALSCGFLSGSFLSGSFLNGCVIDQDAYHGALDALADQDGDGVVPADGDCDDFDSSRYPGALETWYDGVDQDCAGDDDDDADGDGATGVAAGGEDCDDNDADIGPEGAESWTLAFHDADCDGKLNTYRQEFGDLVFFGASANAQAGRRVVSMGPMGESGPPTFAVSSVYESSDQEQAGEVYLVTGDEGGSLSSYTTLMAGFDHWYLGTGLAGGADWTGDGVPDLIVGATGANNGGGSAFLLSGARLASLDVSADAWRLAQITIEGETGSYASSCVAFVDDLDGDGVVDIAVSAPYAAVDSIEAAGEVAIFSGAALRDLGVAALAMDDGDVVWKGYYSEAAFGNVVASAGDQDGDGLPDLLISGAVGVSALIVPGSGKGGTLEEAWLTKIFREGESAPPRMIGDIDGDGTPDLVLLEEKASFFTELARTPVLAVSESAAQLSSGNGSVVLDAVDLGDRDGDARSETALGIPDYTSGHGSLIAFVAGSELDYGASLVVRDLRVGALSTRTGSGFGGAMALLAGGAGEGVDSLLLGGWWDDEGGEDAGAVALLEVPR